MADNGVYVLKTRGANGKVEYRVSYAEEIDNLYKDFDKYALFWFGEYTPEPSRAFAFNDASIMLGYYENTTGYIENGIQSLDFSYMKFPEDDGSKKYHVPDNWNAAVFDNDIDDDDDDV